MMYLYLKTHNVTGYQYLGKTVNDPHKYKGSGLLWQRHLRQYNNDVTTVVLLATESKQELADTGIFFSKLFNVVNNSLFANLTEESGQGGFTKYTAERNNKISQSLTGRRNTWTPKGHNGGRVSAINVDTKECVSISVDDFKNGPYVGVGTNHKGKPRLITQGANNSSYGKKWFTDGTNEGRFSVGSAPTNYWLGRTKRPNS